MLSVRVSLTVFALFHTDQASLVSTDGRPVLNAFAEDLAALLAAEDLSVGVRFAGWTDVADDADGPPLFALSGDVDAVVPAVVFLARLASVAGTRFDVESNW